MKKSYSHEITEDESKSNRNVLKKYISQLFRRTPAPRKLEEGRNNGRSQYIGQNENIRVLRILVLISQLRQLLSTVCVE